VPKTVPSSPSRKRRGQGLQSPGHVQSPPSERSRASADAPAGWLVRLIPWFAVAMAVAVFVGVIHYPFVYDDQDQIVGNPALDSWSRLPGYFLHDVWNQRYNQFHSNYYRPLFLVWLRANEQWFGEQPAGWHVTVILLHALVTLALYWVCARLLKDRIAAGFAALLFAVHPLHVESVAWISGVTEPEFALFFLLSLLCYLRWRDAGRRKWLAWSLAAFALSILSKETGIVLCGLIFFLEWQRAHQKRWKHALLVTLPYVVVSLLYLGARYAALQGFAPSEINHVSAATILLSQPAALWFYLRKLLWPLPMSVFYPLRFTEQLGMENFVWPLLASLVLLAGLWLWSRRKASVTFGAVFLLLPLIPPLAAIASFPGDELVHDRYLYLPSAGMAILMALAARYAIPDGPKLSGVPIAQLVPVLVIAGVLGGITVQQARFWSSNRELFTHCLEVAPHNSSALRRLAVEEEHDHHLQAVLQLGERMLQEDPDDYATLVRVGNLRWTFHDYDGALAALLRARQLHPEMRLAHFWLGVVYLDKAQYAEAEAESRKAIELAPSEPDQHASLGMALEDQRRFDEAIREFEAELQLNPASEPAKRHLALLNARSANAR